MEPEKDGFQSRNEIFSILVHFQVNHVKFSGE